MREKDEGGKKEAQWQTQKQEWQRQNVRILMSVVCVLLGSL